MSERYPVAAMPDVFDACRVVLDREVRPVHYTELTRLALKEIGRSLDTVHWPKQIEDVREKLAQAGQLGIVYVGKPHCVALLREWVPLETRQPDLFPPTSYTFGVSIRAAVRAGVEAQMRGPHMIQKTAAAPERVAEARYRGLLLEEQLRDWFRERYPTLFEPAPNDGQWSEWSPVDFGLRLPCGRRLSIDVTGSTLRGEFRNPSTGKRPVDFRLLVTDDGGSSVVWIGVISGQDCTGGSISLSGAVTPQRMVFWLNCLRSNVPHGEIIALAQRRAEEQSHKPVRWRSSRHRAVVTVPAGTRLRVERAPRR